MFKRFLSLSLVLALSVLCATTVVAGAYTPGTYTATEFGMVDDVVVTMTFSDAAITDVKVVGEKETAGIGTVALQALPNAILEAQSADIDTISGATITADAALKAAAACIAQAKGSKDEDITDEATAYTADVIVIGAGAAGLSAATTAAEGGASVIVLEAFGRSGGSAIRSGGNLNGFNEAVREGLGRNDKDVEVYLIYTADDFPAAYAGDLATVQADVKAYLADQSITMAYDSVSRVMLDHYNYGKGADLDGVEATMDYDYIRKAIENNEDIYQWLIDEGITYKAPVNKHYVTPNGRGVELMEVLLSAAEKAGAKIVYNTRATELVLGDDGKVVGAKATANGEDVTYTANKGVIIATGSFSANIDMVLKYQNIGTGISANTASTNPETNIGDGIVMAEAIGAKLYDMQFVGFTWRGYHVKASWAEMGILGEMKQLAVNMEGKRFVDDSPSYLHEASVNQTDAIVNMVGDKAMYDAIEAEQTGFVADLESRGILFVGNTLEELAEKAGLDPATLTETVTAFNEMVDNGVDPDFGRTVFNGKVVEAPFLILKGQGVNHLTYGGIATDCDAHVLREDNTIIPGLYAAGDVVAGFEGYAHQTGDCMTIVMYYGKVAGANAAAEK